MLIRLTDINAVKAAQSRKMDAMRTLEKENAAAAKTAKQERFSPDSAKRKQTILNLNSESAERLLREMSEMGEEARTSMRFWTNDGYVTRSRFIPRASAEAPRMKEALFVGNEMAVKEALKSVASQTATLTDLHDELRRTRLAREIKDLEDMDIQAEAELAAQTGDYASLHLYNVEARGRANTVQSKIKSLIAGLEIPDVKEARTALEEISEIEGDARQIFFSMIGGNVPNVKRSYGGRPVVG